MSDTTDDMECLAGQYKAEKEVREEQWESGYHLQSNGVRILLTDMTQDHLVNTINYFKDLCDTSELEKLLPTNPVEE